MRVSQSQVVRKQGKKISQSSWKQIGGRQERDGIDSGKAQLYECRGVDDDAMLTAGDGGVIHMCRSSVASGGCPEN